MNHIQKTELFEQLFTVLERVKKLEPKFISDDTTIVTPLQLAALGFVAKHPKTSPTKLGAHVGVSPSAITQLTDRLVALGYIERTYSETDRRTVVLSLTPAGESVFEIVFRKRTQQMQEVLAPLPEQDVLDLIRIYSTIITILEERSHV